jgi:hypothetical protein
MSTNNINNYLEELYSKKEEINDLNEFLDYLIQNLTLKLATPKYQAKRPKLLENLKVFLEKKDQYAEKEKEIISNIKKIIKYGTLPNLSKYAINFLPIYRNLNNRLESNKSNLYNNVSYKKYYEIQKKKLTPKTKIVAPPKESPGPIVIETVVQENKTRRKYGSKRTENEMYSILPLHSQINTRPNLYQRLYNMYQAYPKAYEIQGRKKPQTQIQSQGTKKKRSTHTSQPPKRLTKKSKSIDTSQSVNSLPVNILQNNPITTSQPISRLQNYSITTSQPISIARLPNYSITTSQRNNYGSEKSFDPKTYNPENYFSKKNK